MIELKCNVCKKKIEGSNGYVRISDGVVCQHCWERAGLGFFAQFSAARYTSGEVKSLLSKKTGKTSRISGGKETETSINKKAEAKSATSKRTEKSESKSVSKTLLKQKTSVMDQIDAMEGIEFENYIKKMLERMGYYSVKTTATTGDQGVDLLARKGMTKYAIQCKRYKNSVGNKAVQEVFAGASFYKCDKCIVVTNSHFTNSAKELAKANKVELWDRDKLKELIEKNEK